MKMFYWSLKSIPELAELPLLARSRAWFICVHKTFRHWQTWLGCLSGFAPLLFFFFMFFSLWPSLVLSLVEFGRNFWPTVLLVALGAGLLSVPGIMLFGNIQAEVIRPYLREYLARRSAKS